MVAYNKASELTEKNDEVLVMGQLLDIDWLDHYDVLKNLKGECRLAISLFEERKRISSGLQNNGSNTLENRLRKYSGMEKVHAKVVESDLSYCFIAGDNAIIAVDDYAKRAISPRELRVFWTNAPNVLKGWRTNFDNAYNDSSARVL